ncbi:hypothetical protein VNO78_03499 [Psophocarpus tetragonolobus]|uniref:GATA-type domain-containing protein n=1 Tax=Psophocarpus tetragonolobus TaxID=3891 RepID=A0AAN9XW57_PSOTE
MKIEDAIPNNGDSGVHTSSEVVEITIQANSAAEGASYEVEPKYIASVSFAPTRISRRRRRRHGGEAKISADPDRFCTNFYCKTRRTPMWRKGPLGPKTLCNACGLQYIKTVKGTSSVVACEGDDAVPLPPETVEGDSNL